MIFMLRHILFVMLFSFSEWLWAGSSFSSVCCPVQPVKKSICPLQKKFYVDLGVSKALSVHLSSDQIQLRLYEDKNVNFGVYPAHRGLGIFPDTLQIGVGYAWLRNLANQGLFPYVSMGMEYRQINAVSYPLTLTAKAFNTEDNSKEKGSVAAYKSIPLQNSHLFATVKFNPLKVGCVFPYVSAGLGVSWTQAHNQQLNISVIEKEGEKTAHFQLPEIKQTRLGFRLGSGIDIALTQNLLMSIGYSYNNLGKLTINKPIADIEMPPDKRKKINTLLNPFREMHLGSLTSHNIEFSLRYLFS